MKYKLIEFFINQKKAVNLLILFLVSAGAYFLITAPKEAFPAIDFKQINITTSYPGATPEMMRQLVTKRIEDAVDGISGIKKMTSISYRGMSMVTIEIRSNYKKPTTDILKEVQSSIDGISDFPTDLTDKPEAMRVDSSLIPVLNVFVSAPNEEELYRVADAFEREVNTIEGVGNVVKSGYADAEVWVELKPDRLQLKEINIMDVMRSIKSRNVSLPGGEVEVGGQSVAVRASEEYQSIDEIGDTIVRGNDYGNNTYVKEVGGVSWKREDLNRYRTYKGNRAISLQVLKSPNGDIIQVAGKVKDLINKFNKQLNVKEEVEVDKSVEEILNDDEDSQKSSTASGSGENNKNRKYKSNRSKFDPNAHVQVSYADDVSYYVKNRLNLLSSNAISGFILVGLVLWMFLSGAVTFWTAIEIPVAFLASFLIMFSMGNSLNMMTMTGFIIVLGMIVDDAIVISENIHRHFMMGKTARRAAIEGAGEVIMPVFASIFTTVAAFAPILFTLTGVMGDFLGKMSLVVCVAILVSLFDSVAILPAHLAHSMSASAHASKIPLKERIFDWFRDHTYAPILKVLVRFPLFFVFLFFVAFGLSIVGFVKFVPKTFFLGAADEFTVKVELEESSNIEKTDAKVRKIEALIRRDPTLKKYTRDIITVLGEWPVRGGDTPSEEKENLGAVRVLLTGGRDISDRELQEKLVSVVSPFKEKYKPTQFIVDQVQGGPPMGSAVEVKISGNVLLDKLVSVSDEVEEMIKTKIPNVTNITNSYSSSFKEVEITFNDALAKELKIDTSVIPVIIQSVFKGNRATSLNFVNYLGTENPRVIVRYDKLLEDFGSQEEFKKVLEGILVPTGIGREIPLKYFIHVNFKDSTRRITAENKKNILLVRADVKDETDLSNTAVVIVKKVETELETFRQKYPGISFSMGGQKENNEDLQGEALLTAAIVVSGIFIILLMLFGSFSSALMIMSVIPLGIAGVFVALNIHTFINKHIMSLDPAIYTFSFVNIIGVVALAGVLVNDSSVLISFIEDLRKTGVGRLEAVLEGAASRLRPILLTTLTTLAGLIPFSYGLSGKEPFLQPMGISLVWGLGIGTIITLLFLPCLYIVVDRLLEFFHVKLGTSYRYTEQIGRNDALRR